MANKRIIKINARIKPNSDNIKYPSAEFLHTVSLEDYNRTLANYNKIYDRLEILLAFCGVVLIVILSNFDVTVLNNWSGYNKSEMILVIIYLLTAGGSITLIIISIIQLLLISFSKELQTFDSNSIKTESLYKKKAEDSSLWVTLQYIRCINDIQEKTDKKQKAYKAATILLIIALLLYVVSMVLYNGGIK